MIHNTKQNTTTQSYYHMMTSSTTQHLLHQKHHLPEQQSLTTRTCDPGPTQWNLGRSELRKRWHYLIIKEHDTTLHPKFTNIKNRRNQITTYHIGPTLPHTSKASELKYFSTMGHEKQNLHGMKESLPRSMTHTLYNGSVTMGKQLTSSTLPTPNGKSFQWRRQGSSW